LSSSVRMRYTYLHFPSSYEIFFPYVIDPYDYGDIELPQMFESLCSEQPVNTIAHRTAKNFYIEKENEVERAERIANYVL
jgi:hypothetical protein